MGWETDRRNRKIANQGEEKVVVTVTVADSFSDLDLVSILINNIVAYLDDLNKMYTTSKYDTAIKFLKFWSVFILFAMFAYGYSSIGRYEYMTFR